MLKHANSLWSYLDRRQPTSVYFDAQPLSSSFKFPKSKRQLFSKHFSFLTDDLLDLTRSNYTLAKYNIGIIKHRPFSRIIFAIYSCNSKDAESSWHKHYEQSKRLVEQIVKYESMKSIRICQKEFQMLI